VKVDSDVRGVAKLTDVREKKPRHWLVSLKKEPVKKRIYKTRDLAHADIFDYIKAFYNWQRRHSHLGSVSPEAFEQASLLASGVPS